MPTAAEVLCGKAFGSAPLAGSVWGTPSAAALSWAPAGANVPSSARPAASATPATSSKPIESSKTVASVVSKAEDQNDGMASVAGALLGLAGSDPSRMSHKQVEQHRRLKAKEYFDELRCLVPGGKDTKNDRNRVLALAIDHLKFLRGNAGTVKQEAHDERERTPLMFEMDGMDGDHKELEAKVDQVEGKEEKRLSHNEVEQRRRREAKQHYEELRRHIPNSAKFDKNTVLMAVIAQIKQLAGITDAAMARMLSEFAAGHNEAEGDASAAPSAPTSGCNVFGASAPKSKLSESPSDVTVLHAWGAALPGKEPAPSAAAALAMGLGVDAGCKRPREAAMATPAAAHDVHKRPRSGEGAPASRAAAHGSAPDSGAGMDALSMLSQAAVKVASAPSTPIHGPLGPGKFADLHSHLPTLSELSAPAMVRSEARPCEAGSETCSGSKAPSAG